MYGDERNRPVTSGPYGGGGMAGRESTNLGDILERVLDKGIVIAGDIQVNLLDIELLTIKLRLLVVSVETARELGIDWWEHDPWLSGGDRRRELEEENRRLRDRVADLEVRRERPPVAAPRDDPDSGPATVAHRGRYGAIRRRHARRRGGAGGGNVRRQPRRGRVRGERRGQQAGARGASFSASGYGHPSGVTRCGGAG